MARRRQSLLTLTVIALQAWASTACSGQTRLKAPVSIPFELYHNRVYLQVNVNHTGPFTFVLDSGASTSGLDQAHARELHLHVKSGNALVANGETPMNVGLAGGVTLTLGGVDLTEKNVAVLPFGELASFEGRPIDGVVGVDLFRRYIVEIDYAHNRLVLNDPATFQYSGGGEVVPLFFRGNAALFRAEVEVTEGHTYEGVLAIDQGTYSALRLYKPFVEKHDLLALAHPIPAFAFGLGGEFAEAQGRVQALHIGQLNIAQPVAGYSEASAGATAASTYDGTIGGEILRRFKVIFEYSYSRVVLEPNASYEDPYLGDTSGLILTATGSALDVIAVHRVLAGTPAAEAGIQPGDVIQGVAGTAAARLGLEGIRKLFLHPGTYEIEITRGQQSFYMKLVTRTLS